MKDEEHASQPACTAGSQQSIPNQAEAPAHTRLMPAEIVSPPLPKGVTQPDAVLTDRQVQMILSGLLIPSANATHALAKEVLKARGLYEIEYPQ